MIGKPLPTHPPYLFARRQRRIEQLRGKPGDIGRILPAAFVYRPFSKDHTLQPPKMPASS